MAIRSMTGFGEARGTFPGGELRVEVKSVNNRFLDCILKLPNGYSSREQELQNLVKQHCQRGRVEVFVVRSLDRGNDATFVLNEKQLTAYLAAAEQGAKKTKIPFAEVRATAFTQALTRREVLEVAQEEIAVDADAEKLIAVVEEALKKLVSMRTVEGEKLAQEITSYLDGVEQATKHIEKLAVHMPQVFKVRLAERIGKLAGDVQVDPERLAQEVAFLADKADITEELVRLASHIAQFRQTMHNGEGGRKLDFLIQECNREINTIGSKAQDKEITALVVQAKTDLEKLREQVQNIE